MDSTQLRDKALRLAKTDAAAALNNAREIAERIKDDKCRSRVLAATQGEGACALRDYF